MTPMAISPPEPQSKTTKISISRRSKSPIRFKDEQAAWILPLLYPPYDDWERKGREDNEPADDKDDNKPQHIDRSIGIASNPLVCANILLFDCIRSCQNLEQAGPVA